MIYPVSYGYRYSWNLPHGGRIRRSNGCPIKPVGTNSCRHMWSTYAGVFSRIAVPWNTASLPQVPAWHEQGKHRLNVGARHSLAPSVFDRLNPCLNQILNGLNPKCPSGWFVDLPYNAEKPCIQTFDPNRKDVQAVIKTGNIRPGVAVIPTPEGIHKPYNKLQRIILG